MAKKLKEYRQMRRPGTTPEPFGRAIASGNRRFVVQRHAARRLHYDLRLEWGGTLRSWAVPKGPHPDPLQKRLAVKVEDHPIEYAHFEGRIPDGNYGAGTVIVWDCGSWVPLEDPAAGMAKGKILFELRGYKLKGKWALVKIKKSDKEWLLIKEKDGYVEGSDYEYSDRSVYSGLENKDLAGPRRLPRWVKDLQQKKWPAAKKAWVPPMLATTHSSPFDRAGWIHELKYDGYRVCATKNGTDAKLYTRNGNAIEDLFPEVMRSVARLPFEQFALDAELVVLDSNSIPSFQQLQKRFKLKKAQEIEGASVTSPATLFCFDLTQCLGKDICEQSLEVRRGLLEKLLPDLGAVRFSAAFPSGKELFASAKALRLEGIVSKKKSSRYASGRSDAWLKIRADRVADFVIVGFTVPKRTRTGFGALLVAAYKGKKLEYAGRVGTGFRDKHLIGLRKELDKLKASKAPVSDIPAEAEDVVQWVKPRIVVEVRYKQWNKHLRQASFLRIRDDKKARECIAESRMTETLDSPIAEIAQAIEPPTITNPGKIFWPKEKFTKQDLISYYQSVSKWMLPYLKDRPIVLTRYPDGIKGKSFFQKDAPVFVPEWLRLEPIWSEHSKRDVKYFVCESVEAITYVINMGAIPLHLWASRTATLEKPDWIILDLDPKGAPFKHVVEIAKGIHALCGELGLPNFVKTTGSTGLHILIPLGRQLTHEQSKTLGELLATVVVRRFPKIATTVRLPSKRQGKVYVDFLQNGWGKTIAAPFCVRPLPGAPVSMPIFWREVTSKLKPDQFHLKNALARLKRRGDPLLPVLGEAPDLVECTRLLSQTL